MTVRANIAIAGAPPMPLLFVVEDVFFIRSRGMVVAGRPDEAARYRMHQPVEIRRRDGSVVRTAISGIEHLNPPSAMAGVLFRELTPSDVSVGDEVWTGEATRE
jgi:translation elongation factor EF-Tu-like GTPase